MFRFLLAVLVLTCLGAAAPDYPVPYEIPTPEKIAEILSRLRNRLDGDTKFGTYSYPMGVVYSGMLLATEVTGDAKFADFAAKRFASFAEALPKISASADDARRNPLRAMIAPWDLDSCGAMGAAFVRARRMKVGPDLHEVTDRFADYVLTKQFRIEDGTLARNRPFPRSLWLDDAYMSVPFLAQMGALTGERKYFDDAAKQIKQFHQHLFVSANRLFTHAGNIANPDHHPRYFWGRANGWMIVATVELLDLLPADHPDRDAILGILRTHAEGLASVQSGSGLWHQLLDRDDSYLETSCTAMFTYAIGRGVNRGWLNAGSYGPVAVAGWNGLITRISADGKLDGVCVGTSYADDAIYYYHRPATDDIHGYGPILLAGAEIIRLVKNDHFKINAQPGGPITFVDRDQAK